MNGFCACPNPQSCRCRASQPAHWQGDYPSRLPSFQMPSQAHTILVPPNYSPFTPRSRGPPIQHHYASAYAYDPSSLYDNSHVRDTSTEYLNPSNLTPTHLHQPQYHAPGPLPLVLPPIRVVHQPPAETRGTKRKSADMTVPKHPKHARAPASLDTGPVATRCGVGPPVPMMAKHR
jgi:hypothetical protein